MNEIERLLQAPRVAIIGNGGGGKSTLAHALAARTGLPLHEVDPLQFRENWTNAPLTELTQEIDQIIDSDAWILDGFGPWPTIERRFERADAIVFVDHPLWVHFWWAAERQIAAARGEPRLGGRDDCPLDGATEKVFRAIWHVHENIRPMITDLLSDAAMAKKVARVESPERLESMVAELSQRPHA